MSDIEQKTPNKTGASGAAWSDGEKIAYLIVICENEGRIDAKIANAPVPAGRSIVSCKKLLWRLKEKHKSDIEKIKAGQPIGAALGEGDDEAVAKLEKPKTPHKRKTKAEKEAEGGGDSEGSPKKKPGRPKKTVPVREENSEDDAMN